MNLADIPHTFRWSTKACSCGAPLDSHEPLPLYLFVRGDAPTWEEWAAYVGAGPFSVHPLSNLQELS